MLCKDGELNEKLGVYVHNRMETIQFRQANKLGRLFTKPPRKLTVISYTSAVYEFASQNACILTDGWYPQVSAFLYLYFPIISK